MSTGSSKERRVLLDPDLQSRLSAIHVALRRSIASDQRGDRRAPRRKGISVEFADFRGYVPGDDVRHLDWATYARLDQLIVKLYHDEEDVQLHLLIDDSRSMHFGAPPKARYAREVAAAFAWIALNRQWRVSATLLGDEEQHLPLVHGAGSIARVLAHLEKGGTEAGRRPLRDACREFMARHRPRGAILLISDLFDDAGVAASLRELCRSHTEVDVIQVLAPEEISPELEGDLRLVDVETIHHVEVHATAEVLDLYRTRARRWIAGENEACRRRGAGFCSVPTDRSLETLFLRDLVAARMVR